MRLLVWILGVICTMAALMNAYAAAPLWVWVWWAWLAVWIVLGLVVVIVALVRVFNSPALRIGSSAPAPREKESRAVQGGE